MRYLYCSYNEICLESTFNRSDWSGFNHYEKTDHHFSIKKIKSDDYYNFVSEIPDTGFPVVVIYQTGGTFGLNEGEFYYVGTFNKELAIKTKELIQAGRYNGYSPWVGFFEKLQDVIIVE